MPLAELEERRVYYEEHGDGEPVLLINGLGADHTTWGLQTAFFSKHFRVIVFDNPGIGQTEGPRGPYTSALFADYRAGRLPEAVRTYTRVVDEFPKSVYTADARRQLDELKSAQETSHS